MERLKRVLKEKWTRTIPELDLKAQNCGPNRGSAANTVTCGIAGGSMFALAVKGIHFCSSCESMNVQTLCASKFVSQIETLRMKCSKIEIGF